LFLHKNKNKDKNKNVNRNIIYYYKLPITSKVKSHKNYIKNEYMLKIISHYSKTEKIMTLVHTLKLELDSFFI